MICKGPKTDETFKKANQKYSVKQTVNQTNNETNKKITKPNIYNQAMFLCIYLSLET